MVRGIALLLIAACLTACATTPVEPPAANLTVEQLEGEWLLTMPAGHERTVELTAIDEQHLTLAGPGNLAGRYRLSDEQLAIVDPADNRLASLTWAVQGPRKLVLIDAPSAASVGSNYIGAKLTRAAPLQWINGTVEQRSPAR